jgi:hypothetical protein
MTRLLISRTGQDEADIVVDNSPIYTSVAMGLELALAGRIVACVNACADIPTESLVAMNWQLAPVAGAKPLDVAKLILKMNEYRDALSKIATLIGPGAGLPIFDDIKTIVKETLE